MASRLKTLLHTARREDKVVRIDDTAVERIAPAVLMDGPAWRNRRPWYDFSHLTTAIGVAVTLATGLAAQAGDILRGGAPAGQRGGPAVPGALPPQAQQTSSNAKDALARTSQAIQAVKAMQKAARQAAGNANNLGINPNAPGQVLPNVPDGLAPGGLQVAPGVPQNLATPGVGEDPTLWKGSTLPTQTKSGGRTNVLIRQTESRSVLTWETFNVGKNTTLTFDQSKGGERRSEWISFNKVDDPSGRPSQILGNINADGQVYIINRNGIIFGGTSQVNTRTLVASSLPINDNLIAQGLLNNRDAQFLFSALPVAGGADGTPAFNPTISDPRFQVSALSPTYLLVEPLATDASNQALKTPQFTFKAANGAATTLLPSADYSLTVDPATKLASVTFTAAGLAKIGGAEVKVTYTPVVVKSGNVVVKAGAALTSPVSAEGNGGRLMLVGANVTNEGTLSSTAGQTILAAGLQVGIAAHAGSDPSLRGLDVWVGAVNAGGASGGTATNSGLIESFTGSTTMAGRYVNQLGVIDSFTSVNLNGRIDLLASYGAVGNPTFDNTGGAGPIFFNQLTGVVTLGPKSVTQILPDYASSDTVPGTSLPERSQINIEGLAIRLGADAMMLAPNAKVTLRAGTWAYRDLDGSRTTTGETTGLSLYAPGGVQRFLFSDGQVYFEPGSFINVAGSADVFVPLAQSLLNLELRGTELADSPTQRDGALRAVPLTVDIRNSGEYAGRYWVGTPLGDVTGFAGLIERNAAQLTAVGGNVDIRAGNSIVLQQGSTIDVSGGFYRYEAGMVKTTRLLENGHLVDIADATPDRTYDGIYTGHFTVVSPRWGVAETFTTPFLVGEKFQQSYVQGADGGTIALQAPGMALDGNLLGNTVPGERQRSQPAKLSSISLTFKSERVESLLPSAPFLTVSPNPPKVTFADTFNQQAAEPFALQAGTDKPASLREDRLAEVYLSPELATTHGFGNITIDNQNGDVVVPPGQELILPALGTLTVTAANVHIGGHVVAPGGSLSFTTLNISPDIIPLLPEPNLARAPKPNEGRGLFTLSAGAILDTSGLVIDNRSGDAEALSTPLVLIGGKVTINSFSASLEPGGLINVSGGAEVGRTGRVTYGDAGSIAIRTGLDVNVTRVLGGSLTLGSTLAGFSGSKGGTLEIQSSLIQVGGIASDPNTTVFAPEFFQQGGFSRYVLTGIGAPSDAPREPGGPETYVPAVFITPGTRIEPLTISLQAIPATPGTGGLAMEQMIKPVGQRAPAGIEFNALGSDDPFTLDILEVRGDIVMSAGASIVTDPGATVSFKGGTVTLLGSVSAPAGKISITGGSKFPLAPSAASAALFPLPTVYIGPSAVLSAAGTTVLRPDGFGRRVGTVRDGGTISVAGNIVAAPGAVLDVSGTSDVFDVLPSAVVSSATTAIPLNSGVNSALWSIATIPTRVSSNGGLISFEGSELLVNDATVLGRAGGPDAIGGTLAVFSSRFYATGESRTGADINLIVKQSGATIPAGNKDLGIGRRVLNEQGTPLAGMGYFAVDQFTNGGFNSLDLGAKYISAPDPIPFGGNVRFEGPVTINVPGTLRVAGGGVIQADSPVVLNASYIAIGQPFRQPQNPNDSFFYFEQSPVNPSNEYNPGPTTGAGQLTLNARAIDTGTLVTQEIGKVTFSTPGGDIRGNGVLSVSGELTLNAAQVYPTTASAFTIVAYEKAIGVTSSSTASAEVTLASAILPAGFGIGTPLLGSTVQAINGRIVTLASNASIDITAPRAVVYAPGEGGTVTVTASGTATAPLSAGGTLSIYASKINQNGVLRAPLGQIRLGWDGTDSDLSDPVLDVPINSVVGSTMALPVAQQVTLGAGSLTSVSAVLPSGEGMLIPYGLSPDGTSWIDPRGVNITVSGLPEKKVTIAGASVTTSAQSTIDIRGGGDLYAYRWILGSGGSADLLGTPTAWSSTSEYQQGDLVSFGGSTWTARVRHTGQQPTVSSYWTRVAESYAVIPGSSPLAPYAPFNSGTNSGSLAGDRGYVSDNLHVGDQIYLQASSGLPAGYYTLLPKRYALLPGAFLVTPQTFTPMGTIALPDGSSYVSGYVANAYNEAGIPAPLSTSFQVSSAAVVRQRAQYQDYFANSFMTAAAQALDIEVPQRLPIDAGYLTISGTNALSLSNTVLAQRPEGGRGAFADISSSADIYIVGGKGATPAGATAVLNTGILNSWSIESLLIGGVRQVNSDGTTSVHVRTNNLTLDNAGSPLTGPEITLAANNHVTLAPGSSLVQTGMMSVPAATLVPVANLQLAASGQSLAFPGGGTAIRFPFGTPGNNRITSTVAGTITLANGTTQALTANTPTQLAAGSSVTLNGAGSITFASGTSGSIPIQVGDGALVRVSSDPSAQIVRSGVASLPAPTLTVGADALISGISVTLDSTYGTSLDPSAKLTASTLNLGSGQISILLQPTAVLTGSVVDPHLVLTGDILQNVQQVNSLRLTSYRTIDIYGSGTFGDPALKLTMNAAGIRGYDQGGGIAAFTASSVQFGNPSNVAGLSAPASPSGTLQFNAEKIQFGANTFAVAGYENTALNASRYVIGSGTGGFQAGGNLAITTPVVIGAEGAVQAISATGNLAMELPATPVKGATPTGGLGATFSFTGANVTANTRILLPSGGIDLHALGGDVLVGGELSVAGTKQTFYDLVRFSDAGTIILRSDTGNVELLADSQVSVAAHTEGGNAGTLHVSAAQGNFIAGGLLFGQASGDNRSGSFSLDVGSLPALSAISAPIDAGGFLESRSFRVRTGDVTIDGARSTHNFELSADGGSITVTGIIDASGVTGGSIALMARNSLTLTSTALLTVHGREFNSAGKGGAIRLEAGVAVNGTPNLAAVLDIQAGSTLDLGVDAYVPGDFDDVGSSAFYGYFTGKLHLRAPRVGTGVAVNPLLGNIIDPSAIVVEGFRVYQPAGGVVNTALRNQMNTDNIAFMANEAAIRANLLSGNASLADALVVAPGVEIINLNGNLTLGTAGNANGTNPNDDWNLATFRYGAEGSPGILTMRASGNLVFQNALSDGFAGFSSPSGTPAAGRQLWLANLMDINPLLPTNTQSWSYRLTAGADFTSANFSAVRSLGSLAAGSGSLLLGNFYAATLAGVSGGTAETENAISPGTGTTTRFQVIRTGTGDIEISAGRDLQLRNQFATIYSAGVRIPTPTQVFAPGDFSVPITQPTIHPENQQLGTTPQDYPAQWAMAGGNVTLTAQADIRRVTQTGSGATAQVVTDTSRQLPTNWLYRRGQIDPDTGLFAVGGMEGSDGTIIDPSASTAWWIDYSNFFEGVGALGGGNVTLNAGRDVINVEAFAPTNARMPGLSNGERIAPDASKLLEYGGGDVTVLAGHNIDGGIYYVERGKGILSAGNQITTNSSRSPSLGLIQPTSTTSIRDPLTWLPTTLFLGRGSFDVTARGDILLGQVANTFLLPQGYNNKVWYKTYFQTYGEDSAVNVASFGGSVTHRLAAVLTGTTTKSPLLLWLENQNLFRLQSNPTSRASNTQPWLRLAEDSGNASFNAFATVLTIAPPTLRSTAFSGDVNIVGTMNLFPSPEGTLELAASGSVVGLNPVGRTTVVGIGNVLAWSSARINLSDSNPADTPGIASPFGYQSLVGRSSALVNTTLGTVLDSVNALYDETGSYSGLAASIDIQGALHSADLLHRDDSNPLRIYSIGGDITGLTLYSAKSAQVFADRDVADVALYIQNVRPEDVSIVSAGRDVIPYNENTPLRALASDPSRGNSIIDLAGDTVLRSAQGSPIRSNVIPGDIQISGPGVLEVLAGRNIDLGTGPNRTNGTGVGITSIGNLRNPFLPLGGADLIVLAGVSGAEGSGPAFGLSGSTLDFEEFNDLHLGEGITIASTYLSKLESETEFDSLTLEQQAIVGLETFYTILRDSGRAAAAGGDYSAGFAAIATLFPEETPKGELFTRARDIRTVSGGGISLGVPGGGITMASDIFGNPLTPPGIVTEFGGPVLAFTNTSVDIGRARIFTLRGGDILIWSSAGDIAAGTAPKTVVTAPPTRVVIDATSAVVTTDLGGLATGGGIGVLAAVKNVAPGNVDLIAPTGVVDAGDAGIRSTGNLTIAATAVLNASNISVSGTSAGVPTAPAAPSLNIAAQTQAQSTSAQNSGAARDVAQQGQTGDTMEVPSNFEITVSSSAEGDEEDARRRRGGAQSQ